MGVNEICQGKPTYLQKPPPPPSISVSPARGFANGGHGALNEVDRKVPRGGQLLDEDDDYDDDTGWVSAVFTWFESRLGIS
jgi:hypothetical protein